jgi:hypothetical protein
VPSPASRLIEGPQRNGQGHGNQELTRNRAADHVFAGSGKQFFRDGQAANLRLAAVKTFSKIVKMTYELQH